MSNDSQRYQSITTLLDAVGQHCGPDDTSFRLFQRWEEDTTGVRREILHVEVGVRWKEIEHCTNVYDMLLGVAHLPDASCYTHERSYIRHDGARITDSEIHMTRLGGP